MRLPEGGRKPVEIEHVVSKDDTRPVLCTPWLDVDKQELRATDSYCAVRIPVELHPEDTSGPVPIEALKRIRKEKIVTPDLILDGDARIQNGSAEHPNVLASFAREPREIEQFPNLDQLWPVLEPDCFEIGLDADLLLKLARALGAGGHNRTTSRQVRISFQMQDTEAGRRPAAGRPMLVTAIGTNGEARPEGLLMPVKLS